LIIKRFLFILVLFSITGCSTFENKPIVPDETALNIENRSLDDPGLKTFINQAYNRPSDQNQFDNWGLDDLTLAGFYYNPAIKVAYAQWNVATAGKKSAAERPNPSIGITPGNNQSNSTPTPWMAVFSTNFIIETAGKRDYRIENADQLANAARLNVISAAWRVRQDIWNSFIDLYVSTKRQILLSDQFDINQENLRLLKLQFDAGAISAFELAQARIASDTTKLALLDETRAKAAALAQLAKAIGVPVKALQKTIFTFDDLNVPAQMPIQELRRAALINRADILASLAEYAASQSTLGIEIAKQYPDIGIGPGYEYDQGDNKWSLGLSFTLPLFNQNQGAIAVAEARREEAAANFNALQTQVLNEIDIAQINFRATLNKKKSAEAMLADLIKHQQNAQKMLNAGEISYIQLIGVRLQKNSLELSHLQAEADLRLAYAQLETSLQIPLEFNAAIWQGASQNSEPLITRNTP